MPALAMSEIIILGIRTGIKLSQQARLAYVESTMQRELVLPLPQFDPTVDLLGEAKGFFSGAGSKYLVDKPELRAIFEKAIADEDLSNEEKGKLIQAHKEFRKAEVLMEGRVSSNKDISYEAIMSLVTVRQWARNKPFPSIGGPKDSGHFN